MTGGVLLVLAAALAAGEPDSGPRPGLARLPAADVDRRLVLAAWPAPDGLSGRLQMRDTATGVAVPAQRDGRGAIRWLVRHVSAGTERTWAIEVAEPTRDTPMMTLHDDTDDGVINVRDRRGRLVTSYHHGAAATRHGKPFFAPLRDVLRPVALDDHEPDPVDHPHHTGLFVAHGDVDGRDYWHRDPIRHVRVVRREAGAVFARLVVEHAWGDDVTALLDATVIDASPELVLDLTVTLRPKRTAVVFGRTKEGTVALRLASWLSGDVDIIDALGHRGEPAVRAHRAAWVDYMGVVDGRAANVTLMNHPSSFRYPTSWHVRAYGLFSANPFMADEPFTLAADASIRLRYRILLHDDRGVVPDVFAGFAQAG